MTQPSLAQRVIGRPVQKIREQMRINVDLGDADLYEAIHIIAVRERRPVRELVVEALRDYVYRWLQAEEAPRVREDAAALGGVERDCNVVPLEDLEANLK